MELLVTWDHCYFTVKLIVLIAAYMPYEAGERYALGEHREVPMFYVVGGIITLIAMVWLMHKSKKEKRQALRENRRGGRN